MAWVVRAGEAKAPDLMRGYREHAQVPGLFGFSVQYAPGKSVNQLALSGRFPHAMISYEDDAVLTHAVELVGYRMRLIKSPGHGYHHTFCVIEDLSGQAQSTLPSIVADALADVFQRRANPSRRRP